MADDARCSHEDCNCGVPKERAARGDKYCSDYCALHGGKKGHKAHACDCGHPGCLA